MQNTKYRLVGNAFLFPDESSKTHEWQMANPDSNSLNEALRRVNHCKDSLTNSELNALSSASSSYQSMLAGHMTTEDAIKMLRTVRNATNDFRGVTTEDAIDDSRTVYENSKEKR